MRGPKVGRSVVRGLLACCVVYALLDADPGVVHAQTATGYELALAGRPEARYGEPFVVSGTAFEVLGLATLRPLGGGEVTGRLLTYTNQQWTEVARNVVTADRAGHFTLEVLVPARDLASPRLEVIVGKRGGASRTFTFGVSPRSPFALSVLTDRARYEPGETVHVYMRAATERSGAPLVERELRVVVRDPAGRVVADERKRTRASGAAPLDVPLPASAVDGAYTITVSIEGGPGTLNVQRDVQVARRTTERLMVSATLDREVFAPGATMSGQVRVRTPSGAAVPGASVVLTLPRGESRTVQTGDDGIVVFEMTAPLFLSGPFETQSLGVRVQHGAYGTLAIAVPYTLARTEHRVRVVAAHRYVVPELPTSLFVQVTDMRDGPPPVGTSVELSGPGIAPGARAAVSAEGFAEIPMLLPLGAAGRVDPALGCGSTFGVRVVVDVRVRVAHRTEVCVPVAPTAEVLPTVTTPVATPGADVTVEIARRPSASGRPVLVELLDGATPLASSWIEGSATRATLRLPERAQGFFVVRARPLGEHGDAAAIDREGQVAFGTGAFDAVLVRPRDAFRLGLEAQSEPYPVRGTARLGLVTSSAVERAYVTLVARDLAQHGGEPDYVERWQPRFDEQVTRHDREATLLVRSALAAALPVEIEAHGAPPIVIHPWDDRGRYGQHREANVGRGELRDPLRLRDALLRERIGQIEVALEQALDSASSEPPPDDDEDRAVPRVLTRRGSAIVGFDPRALEALVADGGLSPAAARTLGDGPMTLAMVEAADPSFRFERVAARVARRRLLRLMMAVVLFSSPDDENAARASAGQPPERWLSRMIEIGMLEPGALLDPWGRPFVLRRVSSGTPRYVLSDRAPLFELVSAGADGRYGTGDDVRDPFARVVPEGTIYAVASQEDALMKALSALAPGEPTLNAMLSAYDTISLAARDEQRVSAVTAHDAEMMAGEMDASPMEAMDGLYAEGMVGGSGSGYGRGMGGLSERAATIAPAVVPAPMDDADSRNAAAPPPPPPGQASLARQGELVRERFPATLFFVGELVLDGPRTFVDVPLADALTTYRVEAIAWSASGYVTSARAEVRVDQDATVDAPVPPFATVGDEIRIPVRVQNRTSAPLSARVELASETSAVVVSGVQTVLVPPRDAVETVVVARAAEVGEGSLVVRAVRAEGGAPLDAARRPIRVLPDARLVRVTRRLLLEGDAPIRLEVPEDATARGPAELRLATGFDFFGELPREAPNDALAFAWMLAFAGHAEDAALSAQVVAMLRFRQDGHGETPADPTLRSAAYGLWQYDFVRLAQAIGAGARVRDVADADLVAAVERLGAVLPETGDRDVSDTRAVHRDAEILLMLAPALRAARTGDARDAITGIVRRLRDLTANAAARVSNDAHLEVALAAALATTARAEGRDVDARAVEILRRIDREIVRVGDIAFLEERERYGTAEGRVRPTALLAIARLATGDREGAFACLRSLARSRRLDAPSRFVAALALAALTPGLDAEVRLVVDGRPVALARQSGVLVATLEGLGRPGAHTIDVELPEGGVAWAELDLRYGRPWDAPEAHPLNVAISVEGPVGARDTRAGLSVLVRNQSPRAVRRPVLEIDLPAGVELDEPTRAAITRAANGAPTVESRTLRIPLRALAPGASARVPLPLRFSVGGALRGLGVSLVDDVVGYDDARAYAVLPSRTLAVPDAGAEPPQAEAEATPPPIPPPDPRPIVPLLAPLAPGEEVRP